MPWRYRLPRPCIPIRAGYISWLPSPGFQKKRSGALIHAVGCLRCLFRFLYHWRSELRARIALSELTRTLNCAEEKLVFCGERPEPFAEDSSVGFSVLRRVSNALPEAQVSGYSAVAFDVPGGISEIIRPGENGLLVEDNDLIGFAAAIKEARPAHSTGRDNRKYAKRFFFFFCPGHDKKMAYGAINSGYLHGDSGKMKTNEWY